MRSHRPEGCRGDGAQQRGQHDRRHRLLPATTSHPLAHHRHEMTPELRLVLRARAARIKMGELYGAGRSRGHRSVVPRRPMCERAPTRRRRRESPESQFRGYEWCRRASTDRAARRAMAALIDQDAPGGHLRARAAGRRCDGRCGCAPTPGSRPHVRLCAPMAGSVHEPAMSKGHRDARTHRHTLPEVLPAPVGPDGLAA